MADVMMKTCANCGNVQAGGEFCEKCGARLPALATAGSPPPSPAANASTGGGGATGTQGARPYGGPPASGAPPHPYVERRGFFGRVFDLSFHEFITPSIIKVLFIISIVVIGLGVLALIITGFATGAGTGVLFVIGGLIGGFLAILYVRVILELFIVFFRIHDNTEEMVKSAR